MASSVPLVRINAKALAVEEADLTAFIERRGESPGAGRPRGAKKKGPGDDTHPAARERAAPAPANRRYLAALEAAYEAGLAVDRERYGEGIGTDGEAQVIEMVLADKRLEVFGPARDESRVG